MLFYVAGGGGFAVFGGVNVVMYVVLLCLGFNFYALVFANEL